MAWQDTMGELLRVMVNDMDSATYTDEKVERVLVAAAFQVLSELRFSQEFAADVENTDIAPDPTAAATRDDSFVNLTTLKAACMLDRSSAVTAATRAIYVKDGTSAIDLRGNLQGKLKLLEKGWCAVYAETKLEYQSANMGGVAGAAVMTPFRLYADGWYSRRTAGRDVTLFR